MSLFNNEIRMGASNAGTYEIDRSLRFNSTDTTKLERAFGSGGDTKQWTMSLWVKRSFFGATKPLCGYYSADTNSQHPIRFNSSDQLEWYNYSSGYQGRLVTNRHFRDPSAWYHLVFVWNSETSTGANRMRIYVNGVKETSYATDTTPAEDLDSHWNSNNTMAIGTTSNYNDGWFDGYLAEIHFTDGVVNLADAFGETDSDTGAWVPKKYAGSYGSKGFYLNFSDNSNTTSGTLGADSSGNDNDWTPTNFSVASGEGNDSVTDTPTNNYCTWNPIDYIFGGFSGHMADDRLRNGALSTVDGANKNLFMKGTFFVSSGKWYYEAKGVGHGGDKIGWARSEDNDGSEGSGSDHTTHHAYLSGNGEFQSNATTATPYGGTTYGGSIADGDVIGCAIDMDNNTVAWHNGGQWGDGSGNWDETYDNANKISISNKNWAPAYLDSSTSSGGDMHANFGQQGFAHTPPTGFKALCTANLPEPTIKKASDNFNVVTYTGTITDTSTQAITGVGFQPDMVWIKRRDGSNSHQLVDSARGVGKWLEPSNTNYESTSNTNGVLTAFGTDGFTLTGGSTNANLCCENTYTYVAWNWKAGSSVSNSEGSITSAVRGNPDAGFSIVSWTGTAANATIGHGLGVTPDFIWVKNRDDTASNLVRHTSNAVNHTPLIENNHHGITTDYWNTSSETRNSTVFSISSNNEANGSGDDMIAYCFASVEGYSKFDYYKSQGGSDMSGEFVWTGFRPRWLMIKRQLNADAWAIYDSEREPSNELDTAFYADDPMGEYTHSVLRLDFLSNGFKITGTSSILNTNDNTYIYAAFAETPFKYANAR